MGPGCLYRIANFAEIFRAFKYQDPPLAEILSQRLELCKCLIVSGLAVGMFLAPLLVLAFHRTVDTAIVFVSVDFPAHMVLFAVDLCPLLSGQVPTIGGAILADLLVDSCLLVFQMAGFSWRQLPRPHSLSNPRLLVRLALAHAAVRGVCGTPVILGVEVRAIAPGRGLV